MWSRKGPCPEALSTHPILIDKTPPIVYNEIGIKLLEEIEMATMSYCAFENTMTDMRICVDKLREAVESGDHVADWGEEEGDCLPRLADLASAFAELYAEFRELGIKNQDEFADGE